MKILCLDLETAPHQGWFWGLFDQNIGLNQVKYEGYVLCWCAKWVGEKGIMSDALINYPSYYKKNPRCDRQIAISLHKLLDEADVVLAHNGNAFDLKHANAMFLKHGLAPASSFKSIDTYQESKKNFKFLSHKLEYLTARLCREHKIQTSGFNLWVRCMAGDKKAWADMVKYCKQDVAILEELYIKMRPFMKNHPNPQLYTNDAVCVCGSKNLQRNGYAFTEVSKFQRYRCKDCGKEFRGSQNLSTKVMRNVR